MGRRDGFGEWPVVRLCFGQPLFRPIRSRWLWGSRCKGCITWAGQRIMVECWNGIAYGSRRGEDVAVVLGRIRRHDYDCYCSTLVAHCLRWRCRSSDSGPISKVDDSPQCRPAREDYGSSSSQARAMSASATPRHALVRCAVALRGTTGSPLFALPRLRQIRAASGWTLLTRYAAVYTV